jgi:hypothetical protein
MGTLLHLQLLHIVECDPVTCPLQVLPGLKLIPRKLDEPHSLLNICSSPMHCSIAQFLSEMEDDIPPEYRIVTCSRFDLLSWENYILTCTHAPFEICG